MALTEPAIGYRFNVRIDGVDFGAFTKVEGLSASYDVLKVKEGGENGFVHQIPGRIEYQNVKITRTVDELSGGLARWFSGFHTAISHSSHMRSVTMAVEAMNASHSTVAVWSVGGVMPVSYTGPSFQAGNSGVLTETFELAHTGFLDPERM